MSAHNHYHAPSELTTLLIPKRPNNFQLNTFASLLNGASGRQVTVTELDPQEFIQQLDYHGITLLALQRGSLTPAVVEHIGSRKAMMIANETLTQNALLELFNAFEQAGLSNNILFKGSALAYSLYSQPWLRPRSDSDCLIDYADYQSYTAVFNQLGYQKLFAIEGRHISYQNTFSKTLVGRATINIDLHWRINNRQILANTFNVHELISCGESLSKLSNFIRVPCSVDSILIASLHRLGHHQNEERLAWLYDIFLLVGTLSSHDWQQLCVKAADKKIAAITLDALHYCQFLFDLPIPEGAHQTLTKLALRDEPSQLFLNRDLAEWKYFIHDLKGLPGWSNKLGLIWENVFPNPAYVRQKMGTQSTSLAYLQRLLRGLQRITR